MSKLISSGTKLFSYWVHERIKMKLVLLFLALLLISTSCNNKETSQKKVEETLDVFEDVDSLSGETLPILIKSHIKLSLTRLVNGQLGQANEHAKEAKRFYAKFKEQSKKRRGREILSLKDFYLSSLDEAIEEYPKHKEKLTKFVEEQTEREPSKITEP